MSANAIADPSPQMRPSSVTVPPKPDTHAHPAMQRMIANTVRREMPSLNMKCAITVTNTGERYMRMHAVEMDIMLIAL